MKWVAIVLIAVGGFLIGGVLSLWRTGSRPAAVVVGAFAAAAIAGGVLWMIE